jgi:3-hydroxybutyryl-CoA dehydrogenase
MRYAIIPSSESRSFPEGDPIYAGAVALDHAAIAIYLAGAEPRIDPTKTVILVELRAECLGYHTGEALGEEGSNVLGFCRYRNGDDPPSQLVELVRQKRSSPESISAAKAVFEALNLAVTVCTDQVGRIVDRLARPKYNAALRLLDEGLATQAAIDLTCRLGLGYPEGPIERVIRGGLAYHYGVAKTLFDVYGSAGYAPARRAVVAAQRRGVSR